jgi:tetratricopeptide (TPR) repeat protein
MDPYDLPREFSHLQAQDMGKLGFMQDLVSGVRKLVGSGSEKPAPTVTVVETGGAAVEGLLKRAFMFCEDGDWAQAQEYCEKVLDRDPECAEAYLCRAMARCQIANRGGIPAKGQDLFAHADYGKARRFADEQLAAELDGYEETFRERVYEQALKLAEESGESVDGMKRAAAAFASVEGYNDAAEQSERCLRLAAEIARRNEVIEQCRASLDAIAGSEASLESIYGNGFHARIDAMRSELKPLVGRHGEANALLERCDQLRKKLGQVEKDEIEKTQALIKQAENAAKSPTAKDIDELRQFGDGLWVRMCRFEKLGSWEEASGLCAACSAARDRVMQRLDKLQNQRTRRIRAAVLAVAAVVAAFVAAAWWYVNVYTPARAYENAARLEEQGSYEQAAAAFGDLGSYKDASERSAADYALATNERTYAEGVEAEEAGDLAKAARLFGKVDASYLDADARSSYDAALYYLDQGEYADAAARFAEIGDYADAARYAVYAQGRLAYADGDYESARELFESLGDFSDAAGQSSASLYALAATYEEAGQYDLAAQTYAESLWADYAERASYATALGLEGAGSYAEASAEFASLGAFRDAEALAAYAHAEDLESSGDHAGAAEAYLALGDFLQSGERYMQNAYEAAAALEASGALLDAAELFGTLGDYEDAPDRRNADAYQAAEELLAEGELAAAAQTFFLVRDYADATDRGEAVLASSVDAWEVGSLYQFGTYEQDGDTSNGAEPITWVVLKTDGDRVLLVAQECLDVARYGVAHDGISWGTSTLRTWLNGGFANLAFTASERARIAQTQVDNGDSPVTTDKVFCLSVDEANELCGGSVAATAYARAAGAYEASGTGGTRWWLRTLGSADLTAVYVNADGGVLVGGCSVDSTDIAVRPALWLLLEAPEEEESTTTLLLHVS